MMPVSPNIVSVRQHKKAPDDAGAFERLNFSRDQYRRNYWATPVEAIDQRRADVWTQGLKEMPNRGRSTG